MIVTFFCLCSRYCSAAVQCEVSLPQNASPECKVAREAALAQNKKTFTLKHDPALYGYARLNMTPAEVVPIVFADPFTRYYATEFIGLSRANEKVFEEYINKTITQPINDMSDYLKLTAFFQTVLEPLIGVDICTDNIQGGSPLSVLIRGLNPRLSVKERLKVIGSCPVISYNCPLVALASIGRCIKHE